MVRTAITVESNGVRSCRVSKLGDIASDFEAAPTIKDSSTPLRFLFPSPSLPLSFFVSSSPLHRLFISSSPLPLFWKPDCCGALVFVVRKGGVDWRGAISASVRPPPSLLSIRRCSSFGSSLLLARQTQQSPFPFLFFSLFRFLGQCFVSSCSGACRRGEQPRPFLLPFGFPLSRSFLPFPRQRGNQRRTVSPPVKPYMIYCSLKTAKLGNGKGAHGPSEVEGSDSEHEEGRAPAGEQAKHCEPPPSRVGSAPCTPPSSKTCSGPYV
jgi:hypothetical protein